MSRPSLQRMVCPSKSNLCQLKSNKIFINATRTNGKGTEREVYLQRMRKSQQVIYCRYELLSILREQRALLWSQHILVHDLILFLWPYYVPFMRFCESHSELTLLSLHHGVRMTFTSVACFWRWIKITLHVQVSETRRATLCKRLNTYSCLAVLRFEFIVSRWFFWCRYVRRRSLMRTDVLPVNYNKTKTRKFSQAVECICNPTRQYRFAKTYIYILGYRFFASHSVHAAIKFPFASW